MWFIYKGQIKLQKLTKWLKNGIITSQIFARLLSYITNKPIKDIVQGMSLVMNKKPIISIILILSLVFPIMSNIGLTQAADTSDETFCEEEKLLVDVPEDIENQFESPIEDDYFNEDIFTEASESILSIEQTTQTITVASYDAIELLVIRLYENVLGRKYDVDGMQRWVAQLKNGDRTGGFVAHGFFFSPEFINRHTSNSQYVEILYRTLLGRAPDVGGRDRWIAQLDAGWPRENIFAGFVNSIEFGQFCSSAGVERGFYTPPPAGAARVFVTRLYRLALLREPDLGGLNGWHNGLRTGAHTGASVAYGFIFSNEMFGRNLTDEQFVDVLYNTILGRPPDLIGRANWVSQLRNGASRYSIFVGFVHSNEFGLLCTSHGIIRGNAPP